MGLAAGAALLFPAPACADDWREADTTREAIYLTLLAVDWAQTRNIARNPDRWQEYNPFLGDHPSVGRVDGYFITSGLLHVGIASALPARYRDVYQALGIGFQAGVVGHNFSLGISAKF